MQRFGLIGHPLGHSFSKAFFAEKFQREGRDDHRYDLFDLADLRELPQLLKETPGLRGLNVTIPHKEAIIPYLHELDPVATSVGAVNTITIQDGRLKGYNTDIDGFRALIAPFVAQWTARGEGTRPRALVLGTGGASRAVAYVLRELGIRFRLVSRSRERGDLTWAQVDRTVISVCSLIINTTSLGMVPDVEGAPPLPYEAITARHTLVDLIYNPEMTRFLERGSNAGANVANGHGMLTVQAEAAWALWNA
ncbi:MAG: shikimate dehydrogenase [Flavobacteriales bacterium]|nr:shikimate dehydrogenase [Flavobacteriales bacterium]